MEHEESYSQLGREIIYLQPHGGPCHHINESYSTAYSRLKVECELGGGREKRGYTTLMLHYNNFTFRKLLFTDCSMPKEKRRGGNLVHTKKNQSMTLMEVLAYIKLLQNTTISY
jgi:hypothetical protein